MPSADSPVGAAAQPAAPAPSDQTTVTQPGTIVIDGKPYTQEQFESWRKGFVRDYHEKTNTAAETLREAQAREAAIAEREAELNAREAALQPPTNGDGFNQYEELAPGLGKFLQKLDSTATEMKSLLAESKARSAAEEKSNEDAEAFARELATFKDHPFFNEEEVLGLMEKRGLGLGQVDIAVNALYGERVGMTRGEVAALQRGAGARPPVGNVPGISPGIQPAGPTTSLSEILATGSATERWNKATEYAMNHPQNPGRAR